MIDLITYPILSQFQEIIHFTTTRTGGVSEGNFSSLNLGLYSGDKREFVHENFNRLFNFTAIKSNQLFIAHQTHGDEIIVIDEKFLQENKKNQQTLLNGIDALITNIPDIYIGVTTADCVPILIFDAKQKVIAAVHAGWRGTCAKIVSKTIEKMQLAFKSNPSDMFAVIAPSISAEVYNVGKEVVDAFEKAEFNLKEIFRYREKNIYLDLWKANENILLEKDVKKENIDISERCTFSNPDEFFSARRLGINSGRMISVIGMIH